MSTRLRIAGAAGAALLWATAAGAIEPMSRQQIIDFGKPAAGYSYWWGHGRWRADGTSHGSCSGSCPNCSHSGQYGGDCSGFVAKAWQVPSPKPLDDDEHPYSTYNFDNQTTHWTKIDKGSAKKADAFVYNSGGAGHIFLFEEGDPWGYAKAYECKGCSYGCVYGSRKVDSKYSAIKRNSLAEGCAAHCEGDTIVGADCGKGDCSVYGSKCVDDALGVRCVFSLCPPQGETTVCLDKQILGTCKDGKLEQGDCSAFGAFCSSAGGQPAHCASAFCVGSPQDIPEPHDICFIDGTRQHCDDKGGITPIPCEAGTQCSIYPEVHCQANLGCPAKGQGTKLCLDQYTLGECYEGAVGKVNNCAEIQSYCSTAGGTEPHCVPTACVSGPDQVPTDRVVCTPDGLLGHCKADGSLDASPCPNEQICKDGACVPDPGSVSEGQGGSGPAAGSGGSSAGSAQAGSGPAAGSGQGSQGGSASSGGSGQSGSGSGGKGTKPSDSTVSLGSETEDTGGCSASPARPAPAGGALAALALAAGAWLRRKRGG